MKGCSKMSGSYAFMKLEQPNSLDELTWQEVFFHKGILLNPRGLKDVSS
jgi:hypothetical protein